MEFTVFAKAKEKEDGTKFNAYFTKIKDVFYDVRFARDCKPPKDCPANIIVQPGQISVADRKYTDENGDEKTFKRLYVYDFEYGSDFVDHSADYLFES